jgi:LDH2 family malate/lactate/ureidoglycolate dehydrogenase
VSNNFLGGYLPALETGDTNPRPNVHIVQEMGAVARWDGDRGMGYVVGHTIMQDVIRRAATFGCGFGTVGNSRHYGMAQYYALMALPNDMIGSSMTNSLSSGVVPFQGRESRFDTNPITVAVPAGVEPPFVLDMATTTAAGGKIANAVRNGSRIPSTWALGRDGLPTNDPVEALEVGRLLPLGATKEGAAHKGYGLGLWVDIFSGVLSLAGFAGHPVDGHQVASFFGAWNVAAFAPLAEFKALMDERLRDLRSTPPAAGYDRVIYAGLPEWETEQERRANGIPLHPTVVEKLRERARATGIAFDAVL